MRNKCFWCEPLEGYKVALSQYYTKYERIKGFVERKISQLPLITSDGRISVDMVAMTLDAIRELLEQPADSFISDQEWKHVRDNDAR